MSVAFLVFTIFSLSCGAVERTPTTDLWRPKKAAHYLENNDNLEVDQNEPDPDVAGRLEKAIELLLNNDNQEVQHAGLEEAMHYLENRDAPEVDPNFYLGNPLLVLAHKFPYVLWKALDAYPLELEGKSQYETNYTLTPDCSRALGVYRMGVIRLQHWAGWSEYSRPTQSSILIVLNAKQHVICPLYVMIHMEC